MKKSHKNLASASGVVSLIALIALIGLSASAQTTNTTVAPVITSADPDFLAPASAQAVAAAAGAAQAQAGAGAAQGSFGNTSALTGAYEQHYTLPNPTTQNSPLGLHPTGFGGIAPVFGF